MKVRVWPDGYNQVINDDNPYPPSDKSDDFIIRETDLCPKCDQIVLLDYDEPFGYCDCGSSEWYSWRYIRSNNAR